MPVVDRRVFHVASDANPAVVDEHVEAAERSRGLRNNALPVRFARYIVLEEDGASARR